MVADPSAPPHGMNPDFGGGPRPYAAIPAMTQGRGRRGPCRIDVRRQVQGSPRRAVFLEPVMPFHDFDVPIRKQRQHRSQGLPEG